MTTVDNEELPRAGLMPTTTGHGLLALARQAVQSSPPPAAPPAARPAARPRSGGRQARPGSGVPAALLLVDGLAVTAAVALAAAGAGDPLATLWAACGLFPLLVLLNSAGGLYRLRLSPSVLDEFPGLCGRAAVAAAFALSLIHI